MSETPSFEQLEAWIENYLNGTISEEDKKALESWYNAAPDNEVRWSNSLDSPQGLQSRLLGSIDNKIDKNKKDKIKKRLQRISRMAAMVIFIVGAAFIYRHYNKPIKKNAPTALSQTNDVQPGTTTATLTLSNGRKIPLDSAHSVSAALTRGEVCLINKNGQKVYLDKSPRLNVLNILSTHKGEQSPPIVLADGSKVWVNSASTLRFPVAFTGSTREVFLDGEAYFEVTKDPAHPFIVNAGTSKIRVLGTHFDVMAYKEEPCTYATLLEGAITIRDKNNSADLVPGQQGQINENGSIRVREVDATQSVAWLHGQFPMDGTNILAFMRAVSRWYDVDIVYNGKTPAFNFSGTLDKQVPLSQLLAALNANGIHCELKNRQVILYDK